MHGAVLLVAIFVIAAPAIETQEIKRCNCSATGTFEDKEGHSICNEYTGKCSCLKNVDGKDCDKCRKGYFGYLSGQGCRFCACNMLGAVQQKCDSISGKCKCKAGFTGHKCEFCTRGLPIVKGACCGCNETLSETAACDRSGKCKCKSNAYGDKCDYCKINHYFVEGHGCGECEGCYSLVLKQFERYLKQLEDIKKLIKSHPKNEVELLKFQNKLELLHGKVKALHTTAKHLKGSSLHRLQSIEKKVSDARTALRTLLEDVVLIKADTGFSKLNKSIEKDLRKLETAQMKTLNVSTSNFDSEIKVVAEKANHYVEKINDLVESSTAFVEAALSKNADATALHERLKGELEERHKFIGVMYEEQKSFNTNLQGVAEKVREESRLLHDIAKEIKGLVKALKITKRSSRSVYFTAKIAGFADKIGDVADKIGDVRSKIMSKKFEYVSKKDIETLRAKQTKITEFFRFASDARVKNKRTIEEVYEFRKGIWHNMTNLNDTASTLRNNIDNLKIQIFNEQKILYKKILPKVKKLRQNYKFIADVDTYNSAIAKLSDWKAQIEEITKGFEEKSHEVSLYEKEAHLVENQMAEQEKVILNVDELLKQSNETQSQLEQMAGLFSSNIAFMEELIIFLKGIPLYTHKSNNKLSAVERSIVKVEEYIDYYDEVKAEKELLEVEVLKIRRIIENLPEKKVYCFNGGSQIT